MIVKKRKGISTFIATLLLLLLAVAAGVIIYAYVMGYLGGFGNPNTMGALSIDSISTGPGVATIYIRNIGKVPLTLDTMYIDGAEVYKSVLAGWTITNGIDSLNENVVATLIVNGFTAAKTYEIKLVCKDNTQLTFNLKAAAP